MNVAHPEQRTQTICLLILTGLAGAAALHLFSGVIIPFVLAIFLTYCLTPLIDLQVNRLRIPRIIAIVNTIVLGVIVLLFFALLVTAAVNEVAAHHDEYRARFDQLLRQMTDRIDDIDIGVNAEAMTARLLSVLSNTAGRMLTGTVSGLMSVLSNGTLVLIFMIFMLAGRGGSGPAIGTVRFEIEARTKRYLLTMVFISGVTGVVTGAILNVLGVPFAWMFGFLAFLLNFIPSIGSVIATLLPVPVALLSPDLSITAKVLALVLPGVVQFAIGSIIQPRVMGHSLDLHPVTILLALVLFGIIWGIVGMFLATPITAILKFLFERLEYTRPLARIMAGQLDPEPSFPDPQPPP